VHITFIGGGNMASALAGGLLQRGWQARQLRIVEVDAAARERIARQFGVAVTGSAQVAGSDVVVLAVKPQQLREAAAALAPGLREQLVVSIAAGVRVADLARWLGGYARIVRAMPNTPALVHAGVTGLYAPAGVSAGERQAAEDILGAVGRTLWVADEAQIDAVTAVSGSGPAYVFYFIEALEQAAAELGFDAGEARLLALETFHGAVLLARSGTDDPATLRRRVTSKGGTTERAVRELDAAAIRTGIVAAVRAACERSRELGEELGRAGDA
jgi:pyrroline-5-carboxylate reductase